MKKIPVLPIVLIIGVVLVGGVVYTMVRRPKPAPKPVMQESLIDESLPKNTEVTVSAVLSTKAANTLIVSIGKLNKKYKSVAYEVTYDSNGILKGVNSGGKPIDISNMEKYEKDMYMGACSKNVCKPDTGVKKVSLALELTDNSGAKSQFTEEYQLTQ